MTDAEQLDAALDLLYQSIMVADFSKLSKILHETEHLSLHMMPVADSNFAKRLRSKAIRNGQCLLAAARGVRAAQRRLVDMASASSQLSTYTRGGQRVDVGSGSVELAKRL